jgi:hypothetical protein
MTRSIAFIWLLASSVYAGEIHSHVTITQALTKKRVTLPAYQLRGAPVKSPPRTSTSVDELSRVAIYLDGPGLSPGKPVYSEMRQHNRQFEPDILLIPTGSIVAFPNGDPIFHNVFSQSAGFLGRRIHVPENGSVDIELPIPLPVKKGE